MKLNEKKIVITSAVRTAVGEFGGSLKNMQGHDLGSIVVKKAMKNSKLKPSDVDELIMGQVLTGAAGQNPARQAAIQAGLPIDKTAYVINQVCGSGLRSVAAGYQAIMSNDSQIIIAGGQESMSNAPHAINFRDGNKLIKSKLVDTMIKDGLWDAFNGYHMGITAENVANKWKITRKDQDNFALLSQTKTEKAQKDGKFKNEIVPVILKSKKGNTIFEIDEHPRAGIGPEPIKDGSTPQVAHETILTRDFKFLLLASLWLIKTTAAAPSLIPEAFAAQSLAVIKDLGIPKEKVNVNGGAIALGHPIGASGTRILVTLLHEMIKRDSKKGLATLCIGGGMGIAMCLERNS